MSSAEERRITTRVGLMTEVSVDHGSGPIPLTTLDLSVTRISLWSTNPAPTGALTVELPLEGRNLSLHGRVVREFTSDGGSVWGIEFFGTDHRTQGALASYIATASA